MRYFSFFEVISALIAVVASAFLFGSLKSSLYMLFANVRVFILTIMNAYKNADLKKSIFKKQRIKFKAELNNKFYLNAFDFVFVILFFVFFTLVSYAFLDGVLRFYMLFIAVVICIVIDKTLGKAVADKSQVVLSFLFLTIFYLLSVILIPVKLIHRLVLKISLFIICPIKKKFEISRSKKIFSKKCRDLRYIFG